MIETTVSSSQIAPSILPDSKVAETSLSLRQRLIYPSFAVEDWKCCSYFDDLQFAHIVSRGLFLKFLLFV